MQTDNVSDSTILRSIGPRSTETDIQKQAKSKLAMSRALGAAFLSHQVEELEKSVGKASRSATSNNWRERNGQLVGAGDGKRGGAPQHPHQAGRKRERKDGDRMAGREIRDQLDPRGRKEVEKDADMVIVDASVLVHALGQVKKWCKDGRQEEIVIPLEGDPPSLHHTRPTNARTQQRSIHSTCLRRAPRHSPNARAQPHASSKHK